MQGFRAVRFFFPATHFGFSSPTVLFYRIYSSLPRHNFQFQPLFPASQNDSMPISVICFYMRRPDVTPEHFRSHMEGTHVPLIREVFEMHPPQTLKLRYIVRVKTGAGDRMGAVTSSRGRADPDAPVVLVGSPQDVDWDAIAELNFRDELHVQQCMAVMNGPDGQRIKEDEETIAMTEKTRVVLMGEESSFIWDA